MNSNKINSKITFLIFLIINFAALAIDGLFTGKVVPSIWYQNLNKAPWTPPGWVFGFAWSTIMICFSFYMVFWWSSITNKKWILILFSFQWALNVSWNPIFFYLNATGVGLITILSLTVLVGYLLFNNWKLLQTKSLYILPYFIWLLIATSLNLYIYLYN
jgi:translocator protein